MDKSDFIIRVANAADKMFSNIITTEMASSASARGTGIARRSDEYINEKIDEGKAVIALTKEGEWAGFCYIETWSHGEYVANSGLIVAPQFRKAGVAKAIKERIFQLSREKYPESKLFGLTTGLAVMKINSDLGYEPVTYGELTQDETFWKGCQSCINYEILMSKNKTNCMCTAMLYDPKDHYEPEETKEFFKENVKGFERLLRFKRWVRMKVTGKNTDANSQSEARKKAGFLGK